MTSHSFYFFYSFSPHRDLHSFPTRRSSDLKVRPDLNHVAVGDDFGGFRGDDATVEGRAARMAEIDRKSTRLNSSHRRISYAVFCLKKKRFVRLIVPFMVSHYKLKSLALV